MCREKKYSWEYRALLKLGLKYSPAKYGNVSLKAIVQKLARIYRNGFITKILLNSLILEPIGPRFLRPRLLRMMGASVGKNVFIGSNVYFDSSYLSQLIIKDGVHIAGECTILLHQRNMSTYAKGVEYSQLDYIEGRTVLEEGCLLGHGSMLMPGIVVGEGAIIGARSLVSKPVESWTLVAGSPAKKLKTY